MKSLKKTYKIKASKTKVWHALTNPDIIDKWGGGPAKMRGDKAYRFSLWGGDIYGTNTEADLKKGILVQDWYAGRWDEPSIVTFTLTEKKGLTTLELSHEKIPDEEVKEINKSWDDTYLGPIKDLLEK